MPALRVEGKCAVVVAHPDDETLWAGALLAHYGERFDVICCTIPRKEPVRAWKFFDVSRLLGFHPRLWPMLEPVNATQPIVHLGQIDISGYDLIVTHNEAGEYGHLHHQQVHHWVMDQANGAQVACFGYGLEGEPVGLGESDHEEKMMALQCYDHASALSDEPKYLELMRRYYPTGLGEETYRVMR